MPDKITKDMDGLEQTKIFFSTLWRILRFPILIVVLFFILINVAFGLAGVFPDQAGQTNDDTLGDQNINDLAEGGPALEQKLWTDGNQPSASQQWELKLAIPNDGIVDLRISDPKKSGFSICDFGLRYSGQLAGDTGCNLFGGIVATSTEIVDGVQHQIVTFASTTFQWSGDAYIAFEDFFQSTDEAIYGNGTADDYTEGYLYEIPDGFGYGGDADPGSSPGKVMGLYDAYFELYEAGGGGVQEPSGGEQTFVDPVDQENKQEDFDIWRVETTIQGGATSTADSDILDTYAWTVYVNTTTTFGNDEQDNITSLPESVIAPGETSTLGLSKSTALPSGNYFARSELWYVADEDGDGDLEASEVTILASDEIEFSIDPFSPATYEDPSTATTTDLTVTCDPDSGFFQESLCKMNQTLFIPDPDAVRQFEGLGDEVRNKPPWGYFFVVKDELNKLKSTTTEAYSMPDTSALDSTFDDLKTTVSVILWFVFTVWVVVRFKHIS